MKRFEQIDHTADVGLRLFGKDPREVFSHAVPGFLSLLCDPDSVQRETERTVEVLGEDPADLLVAWLSELNFLLETEGMLFREARIDELAEDGARLVATLSGERLDPDRHELETEIKAVTYHGLRFGPTAEGYEAEVIFDL